MTGAAMSFDGAAKLVYATTVVTLYIHFRGSSSSRTIGVICVMVDRWKCDDGPTGYEHYGPGPIFSAG